MEILQALKQREKHSLRKVTDKEVRQVVDNVLPLAGSSSLALSFLLSLLSNAAASRFANISHDIAAAAGHALSNLPLLLPLTVHAQSAITALRILEILAGRGALSKPVLIQLVPAIAPFCYSRALPNQVRSRATPSSIRTARRRGSNTGQSDTSASESEADPKPFVQCSRREIQLRMAALDCISAIATRDPSALHGFWLSHFFRDPYSPTMPSLLSITEEETDIGLRKKATATVKAMLHKSSHFLQIADEKARSATAFVSLSARVAGLLEVLHLQLARLLQHPLLPPDLGCPVLEVSEVLVRNTSYSKVPAVLLRNMYSQASRLFKSSDLATRSAACQLLGVCCTSSELTAIELPTEGAFDILIYSPDIDWHTLALVCRIASSTNRLRFLEKIAGCRQDGCLELKHLAALSIFCQTPATMEDVASEVTKLLRNLAAPQQSAILVEVAKCLGYLSAKPSCRSSAMETNEALLKSTDTALVHALCLRNLGNALTGELVKEEEIEKMATILFSQATNTDLPVAINASWAFANLCDAGSTLGCLERIPVDQSLAVLVTWQEGFPNELQIQISRVRALGGLLDLELPGEELLRESSRATLNALLDSRPAKLRWNGACAAQSLLRHTKLLVKFGIELAPLFDQLLKGLLDNQHVKLRTQISDALLACGGADLLIDAGAGSGLQHLLDRLKHEREGASFKQVVAIDQLSTKVEVLLTRLLDPAQDVDVSSETG